MSLSIRCRIKLFLASRAGRGLLWAWVVKLCSGWGLACRLSHKSRPARAFGLCSKSPHRLSRASPIPFISAFRVNLDSSSKKSTKRGLTPRKAVSWENLSPTQSSVSPIPLRKTPHFKRRLSRKDLLALVLSCRVSISRPVTPQAGVVTHGRRIGSSFDILEIEIAIS
jgi:hypothetical protein